MVVRQPAGMDQDSAGSDGEECTGSPSSGEDIADATGSLGSLFQVEENLWHSVSWARATEDLLEDSEVGGAERCGQRKR